MVFTRVQLPFYARLTLTLLGVIALGFLIIEGKEFLDPLMFGFLFAILLLPVCNFFEQKLRLPRSAASFVAIILLITFVGSILYLVGSQIGNLANDWPQLQEQVRESSVQLQDWISDTFHVTRGSQNTYMHSTTSKILEKGTAVVGTTFGAVSGLALFFVFIMIFTFLILIYRRLLFRFVLAVCTDEYESVVYDIMENVQKILRQYILGLLLEMLIVSGVACLIFWLLGIKYAILLGIITGIFNIIPYIGIFTALLLSTAITFATGMLTKALFVAITVIAIHLIDSNVVLPIVVGSKVRLNALITFLGIVLGEAIWGLSGMFLSIPTIAILKIVFDRIQDLKPWGFLMGGSYEYENSPAQKELKTE